MVSQILNSIVRNNDNQENHMERLVFCLDCDKLQKVTQAGTCAKCGSSSVHMYGADQVIPKFLKQKKEEKDGTVQGDTIESSSESTGRCTESGSETGDGEDIDKG